MKTQAVRLDDDQIELLEAVVETEKLGTPSDAIRAAIRDYLARKAKEHDNVRELWEAASRRRDEEHERTKAAALGKLDQRDR